jgi:hypothetical protein
MALQSTGMTQESQANPPNDPNLFPRANAATEPDDVDAIRYDDAESVALRLQPQFERAHHAGIDNTESGHTFSLADGDASRAKTAIKV